jgi:glycosyltransferase involved in cell wall biosynthesis
LLLIETYVDATHAAILSREADSMKKIVHLSTAHSATDIRIFLKECRTLAKAGYDVSLIAKAERSELRDGVRILNISPERRSRSARFVAGSLEVFRKAWSCKADLYHFHDPELIPVGMLLRLSGARVIYDVHEDVPKQILGKDWISDRLKRPISGVMRMLEQGATRTSFSGIIAATHAIGANFPDNITCAVQNFPLPEELGRPLSAKLSGDRAPQAIYVGGITRIRGLLENVAAMEHVTTPGARLALVGTCNEPETASAARGSPGWAKVTDLGQLSRQDAAQAMTESRVGIVLFHPVPNHIEAQPNKMFEYMSVGLPVIASDFPLWRAIIDGAKCGLLIDPMDPRAIAKAIDWIFSNPQEADAMGRRGMEAVRSRYNWTSEGEKLLSFYEKVLR